MNLSMHQDTDIPLLIWLALMQVCFWNNSCSSFGRLACYASGTHWFRSPGMLFIRCYLVRCFHLKFSAKKYNQVCVSFPLDNFLNLYKWFNLLSFLTLNSPSLYDMLQFWSKRVLKSIVKFGLQPHGFFNCSPAVDVPPNACDIDEKENDPKDKPVSSGLIAKLWS